MKLNCWEFNSCGRQPGGANAQELGICPAAAESRADGINRGMNAGRSCWAVAGTLCRGRVQGTMAKKLHDCVQCDFAQLVREEEQQAFSSLKEIYRKLIDNCWEFHQCGRQPGGGRAEELGVCPAASAKPLDGLHDGINGGRVCWAIAGTFCRGKVQGDFAGKLDTCMDCDFFKQVKQEQGFHFLPLPYILTRIESVT